MNNKDMPAMPLPLAANEQEFLDVGEYSGKIGLTKLEHFAGLAPIMPGWFETKFVSNPSLNGGIDCMNFNKTESWTTEEAKELMFMAWPVYYAKALLAELEKGNDS